MKDAKEQIAIAAMMLLDNFYLVGDSVLVSVFSQLKSLSAYEGQVLNPLR